MINYETNQLGSQREILTKRRAFLFRCNVRYLKRKTLFELHVLVHEGVGHKDSLSEIKREK